MRGGGGETYYRARLPKPPLRAQRLNKNSITLENVNLDLQNSPQKKGFGRSGLLEIFNLA